MRRKNPAEERKTTHLLQKLSYITLCLGIAIQTTFLFTGGTLWQTVASVLLLATACVISLLVKWGGYAALLVSLAIMSLGFIVEVLGIASTFPFGAYTYTAGLGWSYLGVSLIVPAAWLMVAYPSWLAVCRIFQKKTKRAFYARIFFGGWAMVTWDIFLDSQMVAAGNWVWHNPEPALLGVPGIPLTNYLGWWCVGVVMMVIFERAIARYSQKTSEEKVAPMETIFLWTWIGSVIANLTFWSSPSVAVVGGIMMSTIAVPMLVAVKNRRQKRGVID